MARPRRMATDRPTHDRCTAALLIASRRTKCGMISVGEWNPYSMYLVCSMKNEPMTDGHALHGDVRLTGTWACESRDITSQGSSLTVTLRSDARPCSMQTSPRAASKPRDSGHKPNAANSGRVSCSLATHPGPRSRPQDRITNLKPYRPQLAHDT